MKIYFLSAKPCALTLNGVFYGITDTFERSADITLSDRIYAQFSPEGELPIGFFITEELRSSPPAGCDVYLVKDGIAVYAHDFPPIDFTLRLLGQKRQGELLASLFTQGKTQLSIDSPSGLFTSAMPPSFEGGTLDFQGDFVLVKGEGVLGIFNRNCKRLFWERVSAYTLEENRLHATLPLFDRLQRSAQTEWELTETECRLRSFTLRQQSEEKEPPSALLAYAFFESILLKADFTPFLCDELVADAEQIRAFLGEFFSVLPTNSENECGLVRQKGERLFSVDYYSVRIEKGKIIDITG